MKKICFYFQIHQPYRLKPYRFSNIGSDHYYYDDFSNEDFIQRIAEISFIPANQALLEMVKEYGGKFKFAISISGTALEQMEIYSPEVIEGLRELADTGCVEFLSETYGHSLSSLTDPIEFKNQVDLHDKHITQLFGQKPKVFRNSELIYSDEIASMVYEMGFKGMIAEGAKRVLGWKSPNYVYRSAEQPNLKVLLRNVRFSEDISTNFSNYNWEEYPLTADKFVDWIANTPKDEKVINLFMNYEVLGNFHKRSSGIFEFMKVLPKFAAARNIGFATPSEIVEAMTPTDAISSMHPMSWISEEKDISPWLGNILQQEAFDKLYAIAERVRMTQVRRLKQDWLYLQSSDHFYYMGTKEDLPFSPYSSPYEAFNTYMNVLSDFEERVYSEFPRSIENEELNALLTTIHNQASEIEKLEGELTTLKGRSQPKVEPRVEKEISKKSKSKSVVESKTKPIAKSK